MNEIMPLNSLYEFNDPLNTMRALLSYPLSGFVSQYFTRTRDFSACLHFIDYCYSVIEHNTEQISKDEFERLDKCLIWYRLFALDHLNYWDTYISFFEDTFKEKQYIATYDRDCPVERFGKYFIGMSPDNRYLYIHFLYMGDYRYQIIQRKRERELAGKKLGNVYRHQIDQLSEEEQQRRFDELLRLFESMTKDHA